MKKIYFIFFVLISSLGAYSQTCDHSIPVVHSEVTESEFASLLSDDGITATLEGAFAYKVSVNAGGGSHTHTHMAICTDGVTPVDGFVKGRSDANEIQRTKIGIIGSDTLEFCGQGWTDASGYIEGTQLYMELNSKWFMNIDTYIDFWFVTNEQISTLGYVLLDNFTDGFGSITITGFEITPKCDQSISVVHSEVTESEFASLLSDDGITATLEGAFAYKVSVNAGGGSHTHTHMAICTYGVTPVDGFVKGRSDANEIQRTKIGIIGSDTLEFCGQGWIDATGYIEGTQLYMELNSKWNLNIDTYIVFWFVANEQISTLGYVLLDDFTDGFGSIAITGFEINSGNDPNPVASVPAMTPDKVFLLSFLFILMGAVYLRIRKKRHVERLL